MFYRLTFKVSRSNFIQFSKQMSFSSLPPAVVTDDDEIKRTMRVKIPVPMSIICKFHMIQSVSL